MNELQTPEATVPTLCGEEEPRTNPSRGICHKLKRGSRNRHWYMTAEKLCVLPNLERIQERMIQLNRNISRSRGSFGIHPCNEWKKTKMSQRNYARCKIEET
ncbi:unnamed protein product [Meganyctiphanes norvegica]|uniref:Uncharacterized protein n=1 Tax=Meganyctiphanes norvegica TaxID=48144 RepID=A0AAV2RRW2_MEGNR